MRKQNSWSIVIHNPSNSTTAKLLILSLGFQLRLLKRILIYFPEIKAMSTCVQNLAKLQSYRLLFIKDSVCLNSHMISTFIIDLIASDTHKHTHTVFRAVQGRQIQTGATRQTCTDGETRHTKASHTVRGSWIHTHDMKHAQPAQERCLHLNPKWWLESERRGIWKQIPQHLDPSQNIFLKIQPPSSSISACANESVSRRVLWPFSAPRPMLELASSNDRATSKACRRQPGAPKVSKGCWAASQSLSEGDVGVWWGDNLLWTGSPWPLWQAY